MWHHDTLLTESDAHPVEMQLFALPTSLRLLNPTPPVSHKLGLTLTSCLTWSVFVSTPGRAALELSASLTRGGSWDTVDETSSALIMLRPALVQRLLVACKRLVVRRIFLHLAQESGHAWLNHLQLARLDLRYRITVLGWEARHGF